MLASLHFLSCDATENEVPPPSIMRFLETQIMRLLSTTELELVGGGDRWGDEKPPTEPGLNTANPGLISVVLGGAIRWIVLKIF